MSQLLLTKRHITKNIAGWTGARRGWDFINAITAVHHVITTRWHAANNTKVLAIYDREVMPDDHLNGHQIWIYTACGICLR